MLSIREKYIYAEKLEKKQVLVCQCCEHVYLRKKGAVKKFMLSLCEVSFCLLML
jgi:hypothetical protein